MFLIARKNLFTEKTRFFISVIGVAFAVLLIIILWGLYQNWNTEIGNYLNSIPADFWVTQAGMQDMFHSRSLLPDNLKSEIERIEGVESVNKFLAGKIVFKIGNEDKALFLVGFDTTNMIGKPLKVVSGQEIPLTNEIIIDRVFTQKNNLKIGDEIYIKDRDFKIVGISEGGNMVLYQYAFVRQEEVQELFNLVGRTNFFLVKIKKDFKTEEVSKKIQENITEVDVLTQSKFVDDNRKVVRETFLPILLVLSLIGVAVGVAVVGLTIYTATIEKSREFGILKAIGMENHSLYQIVFTQSLISAILGFVLGLGLSYLVAFLANLFVPEFAVSIEVFTLFLTFLAAVLMGIIASYIPLRRIVRIDPALVFKA